MILFHNIDQIDFFFAVQEIEAWLIPFTGAISQWAKISEEDILKKIKLLGPLEELHRPGKIIDELASHTAYGNHKSFKAMNALISKIEIEEANRVYDSLTIASFNNFFERLTSLKSNISQRNPRDN